MSESPSPPGPDQAFTTSANGWWGETKVAAAFLTRLPVAPPDGRALADAARGFPVVGLAVGAAGAVVYALAATLGLPAGIAAVLATGAMILATGGLHEDGLADMADGFGGGRDRDHTLAIMRDSRIGSFGVIALTIVLALRAMSAAEISGTLHVGLALIAASAASRAVLPAVMHYLPPARSDGLSAGAGKPSRRQMIDAGALGAAILFAGLGPLGGLAALAALALATLAIAALARHRIGGQTGDVLGAAQQAAEVAILLAAVATQT